MLLNRLVFNLFNPIALNLDKYTSSLLKNFRLAFS